MEEVYIILLMVAMFLFGYIVCLVLNSDKIKESGL
jgi:hypothetical protein